MSGSLLDDAFDHHVWATLRLIDACLQLTAEQLQTAVPGTYGSILHTMRHVVGSDPGYLYFLTGDHVHDIETEELDLPELRAVAEREGAAWSAFLAENPDPEAIVKEIDETDGYERDASIGIRLAQALHHGTDHRSQICTALTTLDVQPPSIDVWAFGVATDRIIEVLPP